MENWLVREIECRFPRDFVKAMFYCTFHFGLKLLSEQVILEFTFTFTFTFTILQAFHLYKAYMLGFGQVREGS